MKSRHTNHQEDEEGDCDSPQRRRVPEDQEDEDDTVVDSPLQSPKTPVTKPGSSSRNKSDEDKPSSSRSTSSSSGRPRPPAPPETGGTPKDSSSSKKPSSSSSKSNSGIGVSQHSQSSSATKTRSNSGSSGRQHRHQKGKTRRLQWKKSVRVNVIPNLSYFSEQEKINTWYQPDEYSLMEDECDLTSECLDAKKPLWPGFCGRGLESWTIAGEQRKEQHVQLAIDIVWQAQLDQWRQASNTDECWEFIRSQYLQISKPCLRLANQIAENDEKEIQGYLSSVKALEKSRRKMLGIRTRSSSSGSKRVIRRGKVGRAASDVGLSPTSGPRSPRRSLSDAPCTPTKPILRPAIKYSAEDIEKTPRAGSSRGGRKIKSKSSADMSVVTEDEDDDEDDDASTLASSIVEAYSKKKQLANKKIEFKPKSKTKVPTSPVGSVATLETSDSGSTMRRMRSHMSVASDDSTRRRMMRTAGLKNPL